MNPPTCFYMLAMFRLVFRIRVDVKFSSKETIGSECFPFLIAKPWLFLRFLLSISISGDSASDFLDMKMLIGSVT